MVKLGPPRPVKAVITTPVRALETIYQNTTGRPLLVLVTFLCNSMAIDDQAIGIAEVEDATPPVAVVQVAGNGNKGQPRVNMFTLSFMVPTGYYYRVSTAIDGASTVTKNYWTEVEL